MKALKDFLIITFGTILVAVGVYFFKFPNNFTTGGVSGISLILGSLFKNLSAGSFVLIINMILLLLGFLVFGTKFGIKTAYGSILMSLIIFWLEKAVPLSKPLTSQPFLELTFSILLPSVGSAILFNNNASTGGTDIVAMILKKFSSIDIGKALFCTDAIVAISACFVFGIETGLFSILGLLAKAIVVDTVIENFNTSKYFMIVTDFPKEVCEYINSTIKRSATVWDCRGAFSNDEKYMILTAMSRSQAINLRKLIKVLDKHAFILVSDTSDIIGKGFRETI